MICPTTTPKPLLIWSIAPTASWATLQTLRRRTNYTNTKSILLIVRRARGERRGWGGVDSAPRRAAPTIPQMDSAPRRGNFRHGAEWIRPHAAEAREFGGVDSAPRRAAPTIPQMDSAPRRGNLRHGAEWIRHHATDPQRFSGINSVPTSRDSRTWRGIDSTPCCGSKGIRRSGFGPTPRSHNDSPNGFGRTSQESLPWRGMNSATCRGSSGILRNAFGPMPLGFRKWRGMVSAQ